MSDSEVERLRGLIEKAPANTLLRVALVRRLISLGEDAEALSIALDLDQAEVKSTSDRRVLSGLFRRAGMEDEAEALDDDRVSMLDEEPDFEPPNSVLADEPDRPEKERPTGRVLRVVGGRDAAEDDVPDLPDPPDPDGTPITFADVGGLDDVKADINRRIILPFARPGLIQRFRKRTGGGVLMYGPPGCGKTLLARATAGECGASFVSVALSEVLDPFIGGSEDRLSRVFRTARAETPAILFFDEIEALGARRSTSTSSHIAQLASHFLSELDGVGADNDGVLVLAATNAPWAMDAAFLRPGRFDRLFFVPPPDRAAREQIFELELADRLTAKDIDCARLAAATSGRSGADIRAVVERAADTAIDRSLEAGEEVAIDQAILMEAARETRSTVAEWLTTARNHATYSNEGGRYDEILTFLDRHGRRR